MSSKPPRWCPSCRAAHDGECPNRPVWQKPSAKASGRGGRPWTRKREYIFRRDNFLCQICLQAGALTYVELHGEKAGVCDHKIPLSQGGTDDEENLQTICKRCDKEKTALESRRGRGG